MTKAEIRKEMLWLEEKMMEYPDGDYPEELTEEYRELEERLTEAEE